MNEYMQLGAKSSLDNLVWNQFSLPKHRFIAWLVVLDKLSTVAPIKSWGPSLYKTTSYFYDEEKETRDHIFLTCSFCKEVWRNIREKILFVRQIGNWLVEFG